jgi:hypothetical protein
MIARLQESLNRKGRKDIPRRAGIPACQTLPPSPINEVIIEKAPRKDRKDKFS